MPPPILSQPLPYHPNEVLTISFFQPDFECSHPMFPCASFDLSANKSTNSHLGGEREYLDEPVLCQQKCNITHCCAWFLGVVLAGKPIQFN